MEFSDKEANIQTEETVLVKEQEAHKFSDFLVLQRLLVYEIELLLTGLDLKKSTI